MCFEIILQYSQIILNKRYTIINKSHYIQWIKMEINNVFIKKNIKVNIKIINDLVTAKCFSQTENII